MRSTYMKGPFVAWLSLSTCLSRKMVGKQQVFWNKMQLDLESRWKCMGMMLRDEKEFYHTICDVTFREFGNIVLLIYHSFLEMHE